MEQVSPILDLENGCFHSYCVFYIIVHFALSLGNQPCKKISAEYKVHSFAKNACIYAILGLSHIVMSNKSYGHVYINT